LYIFRNFPDQNRSSSRCPAGRRRVDENHVRQEVSERLHPAQEREIRLVVCEPSFADDHAGSRPVSQPPVRGRWPREIGVEDVRGSFRKAWASRGLCGDVRAGCSGTVFPVRDPVDRHRHKRGKVTVESPAARRREEGEGMPGPVEPAGERKDVPLGPPGLELGRRYADLQGHSACGSRPPALCRPSSGAPVPTWSYSSYHSSDVLPTRLRATRAAARRRFC